MAVAKKMYGIKNPEVETKESLHSYARSINVDTAYILTVDTSAFLGTMLRIGSSMPEAEIFNARGENLSYKAESQDCNAGLFSFIPHLKTDTTYHVKDKFTLAKQLQVLRDLDGNLMTNFDINGHDYFLFIYWTKWLGKLNKDHVREWIDLAASNKGVRIKVVALNLDFQSWWPPSFRDKTIARMSKK